MDGISANHDHNIIHFFEIVDWLLKYANYMLMYSLIDHLSVNVGP